MVGSFFFSIVDLPWWIEYQSTDGHLPIYSTTQKISMKYLSRDLLRSIPDIVECHGYKRSSSHNPNIDDKRIIFIINPCRHIHNLIRREREKRMKQRGIYLGEYLVKGVVMSPVRMSSPSKASGPQRKKQKALTPNGE